MYSNNNILMWWLIITRRHFSRPRVPISACLSLCEPSNTIHYFTNGQIHTFLKRGKLWVGLMGYVGMESWKGVPFASSVNCFIRFKVVKIYKKYITWISGKLSFFQSTKNICKMKMKILQLVTFSGLLDIPHLLS
jgi:hypothetical protein